jgi:hypothetical protein
VNDVKEYLDTMKKVEVVELQKDTMLALEDLEDTNKAMAVYRDGDDLLERVRTYLLRHGGSTKSQGCVQADGCKNEASHATGVSQNVLHSSWILLRKVVGKIRILSSDQPVQGKKFNPLFTLAHQLRLLLRKHHRRSVKH